MPALDEAKGLLGDDRPTRPDWLWEKREDGSYEYWVRENVEIRDYINHLEQAATDALAVLDNMEEPDAEKPKCPFCGEKIWCEKCDPYGSRTHGSKPFPLVDPPDDVGRPQSDAMGGSDEPKHHLFKKGSEESLRALMLLPEEPEREGWKCNHCHRSRLNIEITCRFCGETSWYKTPPVEPQAPKGKDPFIGGPLSDRSSEEPCEDCPEREPADEVAMTDSCSGECPPPTEEPAWMCIQCASPQPAANERCKSCGQKRPEPPEEPQAPKGKKEGK
jgi:hypothetical protein